MTHNVPSMNDKKSDPKPATPLAPQAQAPALMMVFWLLLGGAAGIKISQSLWQFLGWSDGEVSVAVPVGGVVGAIGAALLGLVSNPRLLVLLMAVFAGSAAGGVAGKLAWGNVGEIAGQAVGGLLGAITWATWLSVGGGRNRPVCAPDDDAARNGPPPSCGAVRQERR